MASTQVNPTRMELTRLKKKLATATRGHKLLKDKRDELMRQFLDLVRENMALRQKVEAGIRSANVNFVIAKAGMSEQALNTALAAPKQAVYLEADKKNVMSVDIRPGRRMRTIFTRMDLRLLRAIWTGQSSRWRTFCRICCGCPRQRKPASSWQPRSRKRAGESMRWNT